MLFTLFRTVENRETVGAILKKVCLGIKARTLTLSQCEKANAQAFSQSMPKKEVCGHSKHIKGHVLLKYSNKSLHWTWQQQGTARSLFLPTVTVTATVL
jgi:hypothetical protein